jgi:hypothetical protein
VERLLDLAREELRADVEILPTEADLGLRPHAALDVPLLRADGNVRGALRITPRRSGLDVAAGDRMVRLLARLIAEQLDAPTGARGVAVPRRIVRTGLLPAGTRLPARAGTPAETVLNRSTPA